ncbi:MAG: metalloregulator ArsR/SmtB family transcription factor [Fulvivirga sp.]|nr:metalloregulator ArsR/SmtB family transcription factor [Fulvivirga sp.]
MRRDVYQAIADPTRREIIDLIAHHRLSLNEVARNFEMSRPAVSKHIKILQECGLVTVEKQGRERYCEASLEPLAEVVRWTEKYRSFWNARLDRLEQLLLEEDKKK